MNWLLVFATLVFTLAHVNTSKWGWSYWVGPKKETVKGTKLLVIFVDALRYDYYRHYKGLRGIPRLMKNGVRAEYLQPVYPTLTLPNYYAFMTGRYPENNGIISNFIYDPWYNEEFKIGENIESYHTLWWNAGDPIWVTAKRQGKSSVLFYGFGCNSEIKGYLPDYCEVYPNHAVTVEESRIVGKKAIEFLSKENKDFAFIYFEMLDHMSHLHGPFSKQMNDTLRAIDHEIDQLLDNVEESGLSDKLNIMLFSDHGFTFISPNRVVDLRKYLHYDDILRFEDEGMWIWPKPGRIDKVYNDLKNIKHAKCYKKEDIPDRYHNKNNYRVSPIMCVIDLGYTFLTFNETEFPNHNGINLKGTHGYDNIHEEMRASLYAIGPDFKKGAVVKPVYNVDCYEVMCKLLGIKSMHNDGNFSRIAPMLNLNSSSSTFSTQLFLPLLFCLLTFYLT